MSKPGRYLLPILSGSWELPKGVPFAEKVPKAGASCATCDFLSEDGEHCENEDYQEHHGSSELGAKAERWCCVAWTPEGGR